MCHPRLEFVASLCRLDTGPIVDPHGGAVPQASAASPGAPHETGKPTPGSAIARGFPKQWWSSDVAPIGRRRKPSWFRETGLPLIRHLEWPPSRPNRPLDFPIGVILTDGISGPDRGRDPTDHGDLQNQAHDSCDRTIDREKGQPRQQDSDEQAHAADPRMISSYPICYHDTTWCALVTSRQWPGGGLAPSAPAALVAQDGWGRSLTSCLAINLYDCGVTAGNDAFRTWRDVAGVPATA